MQATGISNQWYEHIIISGDQLSIILYCFFGSHQVLEPALSPALEKEVALLFWMKLDVRAVRPLCCRAHTMELAIMIVYGLNMQELFAHWQVKYVSNKKDLIEIKSCRVGSGKLSTGTSGCRYTYYSIMHRPTLPSLHK